MQLFLLLFIALYVPLYTFIITLLARTGIFLPFSVSWHVIHLLAPKYTLLILTACPKQCRIQACSVTLTLNENSGIA